MSSQKATIVGKSRQRWLILTLFVFSALSLIPLTTSALNGRAAGEEPPDASAVFTGQAPAEAPQPPTQPAGPQVITIPAPGQKDSETAAPVPPPVEVARVTLLPSGFTPATFTRPAGLLLLAFDNRSGLRNITLRLDQVGGVRLREVPLRLERLDWRGLIPLLPGSYTLTEANHPGWVCRITITAP